MKILIVAMAESIHTARWISQITDQGWEIFLFPSMDNGTVHESIKNVTFCMSFSFLRNQRIYCLLYKLFKYFLKKIKPSYLENHLHRYIKKIKPDIIHTMETQAAGYIVESVKTKHYKDRPFPIWWHTNWGSDIYLFGRLKVHIPRIKKVMANCDYYSCECQRDVELAKRFGFTGKELPIYPNTGGFKINLLLDLKKGTLKPSRRKCIMLKGYQGWSGRALVGLRALNRAKDILIGYTVIIYSNSDTIDIKIAAELFSRETGVAVRMMPRNTPHEEILKLHGTARISIGLSISDSISTSVLEAMAMGSLPIQSWTSAADEWIEDGKTGLLVPPEDPEDVEAAIRIALTDDELVDRAAEQNWVIAKERLDYEDLKKKTIDSYRAVYKYSRLGGGER